MRAGDDRQYSGHVSAFCGGCRRHRELRAEYPDYGTQLGTLHKSHFLTGISIFTNSEQNTALLFLGADVNLQCRSLR